MKTKTLTLAFCFAIFAITVLVFSTQRASAVVALPPTSAPTVTPGRAVVEWIPSTPLSVPLITKEQAIQQVVFYDVAWATWVNPWNRDGLILDPNRVLVELFASRTEESKDAGRNEWFAPEIDADAGAVWRVKVKGEARVNTMFGVDDLNSESVDGITYVISGRTGNLLSKITDALKR